MNFGIPYMGSKSKIVSSIAANFPKAENFYDLFGGGFSMTHYAMLRLNSRFKNFHYNEIESDIVGLIKESIAGKYNYKNKPKWISSDEFNEKKSSDAYIRCIWSFGNNQKNYLFSKEIEPYKKSMHQAVIFDEFDDISRLVIGDSWPKKVNSIYLKRLFIRQKIEYFRKNNKIPKGLYRFLNEKMLQQLQQLEQLQRLQQLEQLQRLQQLQQLERLEQLQQLEQLERLQQLEQLQQLEFSALSYEHVIIKENSVVYCDIPYKGTASYLGEFNHAKFFDWASSRGFPVFISEYNIDDFRFEQVYEVEKRSMLDNSREAQKIISEKLYWNGVTNGLS